MKTEKKTKTNSYKKMGIFMLVSTVVGGILGFLSSFILDGRIGSVESGMTDLLAQFQRFMLPILIIITVLTLILGERNFRRMQRICKNLLAAEDEECDRWEYEEEKAGALGSLTSILSQVLSVLALSAGYSLEYITSGHSQNLLISCLVFLLCYAYNGFWQVRYVKTVQKAHPEKKGDPTSKKFRQQWLASCDEAEKEMIYQSAYKSYIQISTWIPILLVITMIGHLLFDTGIMAILIVAVIWLIAAVSYLHSCVNLKGAKLRE